VISNEAEVLLVNVTMFVAVPPLQTVAVRLEGVTGVGEVTDWPGVKTTEITSGMPLLVTVTVALNGPAPCEPRSLASDMLIQPEPPGQVALFAVPLTELVEVSVAQVLPTHAFTQLTFGTLCSLTVTVNCVAEVAVTEIFWNSMMLVRLTVSLVLPSTRTCAQAAVARSETEHRTNVCLIREVAPI
jgi:hypothetical protein